jgi:C1A family cysteine protease
MKFLIIFFILSVALSFNKWESELTLRDLDLIEDKKQLFKEWSAAFDRKYEDTVVEAVKYMKWLDNLYKIAAHNTKYQNGESTYALRLNQFSDMNSKEFRTYVHGHDGSCIKKSKKKFFRPLKNLEKKLESVVDNAKSNPTSVDWTTKGVVTGVKNQGNCGSCWAFSTTGSIECVSAISTGKLISLSEQQLMDCSRSEGNLACSGGLMDYAFEYVKKEGGLCTEADYPYKAKDSFFCKANECTKYDAITGYVDVKKKSASDLETAVASGCVSVAIEADQTAFQSYSSGVLTGKCGTSLDHGVLVVGYGEESGEKFWKVKNSWGDTWGESGYVNICKECSKNEGRGECGILMSASYPTV